MILSLKWNLLENPNIQLGTPWDYNLGLGEEKWTHCDIKHGWFQRLFQNYKDEMQKPFYNHDGIWP